MQPFTPHRSPAGPRSPSNFTSPAPQISLPYTPGPNYSNFVQTPSISPPRTPQPQQFIQQNPTTPQIMPSPRPLTSPNRFHPANEAYYKSTAPTPSRSNVGPTKGIDTRIWVGKFFCITTSVLFGVFIYPSHMLLATLFWFAVFYYLWTKQRGDSAVSVAALLFLFICFYGSYPALTLIYHSSMKYVPVTIEARWRTSEIQEEIVVDLRMSFENFNSSAFIDELSEILNVPKENIRIRKRYSTSDQTLITIYIQILRRADDRRGQFYSDELRSLIHQGRLQKFRVERIERLLSREEEEEQERMRRRSHSDYDDDFLKGEATVDVIVGPQMQISGGGQICRGQKANITFTMDGSGPWTIVYNSGSPRYKTQVVKAYESPLVIETDEPGVYTFGKGENHAWTPFRSIFEEEKMRIESHDNLCPPVSLTGVAMVSVKELPTAEFQKTKQSFFGRSKSTKGDGICHGEKQQLAVALTGSPPWSLIYSVQFGDRDDEEDSRVVREENTWTILERVDNILSSPHIIETDQSGVYRLLNVSDTNCNSGLLPEDEKHVAFIWVKGIPRAQISGGKCAGDDIIATLVSGEVPWTIAYSKAGVDILQKDIRHTSYRIHTDPQTPSEYRFESIYDRNCNGTIKDAPVVITPLPNPSARLAGGGSVLEGKFIDLIVHLTGTPPWSFSYMLEEEGTQHYVTDVTRSPYKLSVTKHGTYRLTSVNDANCGKGTFSGSASVTLYQLPSGYLKQEGDSFCEGQKPPVLAFYVFGSPPFTIEWVERYEDGREERFTRSDINESPYYYYEANKPGQYVFTRIIDGYSHPVNLKYANAANIKVHTLPNAAFETPTSVHGKCLSICEDEKEYINVRLTGSPPWSLTYRDGKGYTTESDIQTSPFILTASKAGTYQITRVEDTNCVNMSPNSGTVCVEAKPTPTCEIIRTSPYAKEIHLPLDSEVQVKCNGTAPFKLVYFNGFRFTTKTSNDPWFTIPLSTPGSYSFANVMDASDCKGVIIAPTIVVEEKATGSLTASQRAKGAICPGQGVELLFSFTGTAPWTAQYSHTHEGISQTFTIRDIQDSPHRITVYQEGVYKLVSVSDKYAAGELVGEDPHVLVTHAPAPHASITSLDKVCEGGVFHVNLQGNPPWAISYTITELDAHGINQTRTETNIQTSPFVIQAKLPGTYTITKISDTKCSSVEQHAVFVYAMPRATIEGGGTVCVGDRTNITVHLTGTKPWSISYVNEVDGIEKTDSAIITTPHIIQTGKAGNYHLTGISDANCSYKKPRK